MEGGTTFCPAHTHTEIIECLHGLITGSERHSCISNITFADVYSAAPYILVAQHAQAASSGTGDDGSHGGPYYFLSRGRGVSATRRSRAVDGTDGKGHWHTEVGRKRVEGTAGGYMSHFSYQEKTASGTTRPGAWLMVEYSIDGCDDYVIAKVYRSLRRQATSVSGAAAAAAHGAPQFFAGQYVSGAAATAHGEPQFLAGQYDVSGAAAAAHSEPQFLAGQYNVSGAVDHLESLQAELANYTFFPNHDNGNHGTLQYAIAGQYNVSGGAAATAHGAPQFLAGQYNVSGAAAASHGAPQFFAGQYNVSDTAATAHGEPQFLAGQYNVSGAAAAAHGEPEFLAGQYNVSGAVDHVESLQAELANYTCFPNHDNDNHGALQYAIARHNVSGAATAAHGAPQFLAGHYNVSGAAAASHGAPQFFAGQYVSGAAAIAAHSKPEFLAGQYNVSGAVDHVEYLQAELANYTCFPNHDKGNHGALQYAIAGQYNVSGAAAAAHGAPQYNVSGAAAAAHGAPHYNVSGAAAAAHGAPQFFAGQYVPGAAATAYGAPQFLSGQYNVSGASHASAAHYLTAALQFSPGHADHANNIVLGHNQTVLGARYELQGQVAQHLIPEPAIVVGKQRMLADEVVHDPSPSGGLANLDFDADLYAW